MLSFNVQKIEHHVFLSALNFNNNLRTAIILIAVINDINKYILHD